MKKATRRNRPLRSLGRNWWTSSGSKRKRRKGRYMPGWITRRKENRTVLNRKERRQVKGDLHG